MSATSFYKRSTFVTHLPVECLYSPSHFWLARIEGDRWRVGFTKFATRMLGEIVEVQWDKAAGDAVASGAIIGSIEGFKAISDIYCVADGSFAGGNPGLVANIEKVGEDPYGAGWLLRLATDAALDADTHLLSGAAVAPAFEAEMALEGFVGTSQT